MKPPQPSGSASHPTRSIISQPTGDSVAAAAASCAERYASVRRFTETLCEGLETEDYVVQTIPDVSPTRWHLAHVTWFFETFVLARLPGYRPLNRHFDYLFNSYYNSVGQPFPRAKRGWLTRPTVSEVYSYRQAVDVRILEFLHSAAVISPTSLPIGVTRECLSTVELGIQHEQQHQELLLTDIKHVLAQNPLYPAFRVAGETSVPAPHESPRTISGDRHRQVSSAADDRSAGSSNRPGLGQVAAAERAVAATDNDRQTLEAEAFCDEGGLVWCGHTGDGFCYDNELPRHQVWLPGYALGKRLVTNGEYLQFVDDRGYERPELWLSLGWNTSRECRWQTPLYWVRQDDEWFEFTLHGLRRLNLAEPVTHVSLFEADAFARWAGRRLPTEAEWEQTAWRCWHSSSGWEKANFVESGWLHPTAADGDGAPAEPRAALPQQMFGDVWEWTSSAYAAYPGYVPAAGALGEYNGKFMCNQYVLRGGSCATSRTHIRPSYRNFFPADARWQFSGIRLAHLQ